MPTGHAITVEDFKEKAKQTKAGELRTLEGFEAGQEYDTSEFMDTWGLGHSATLNNLHKLERANKVMSRKFGIGKRWFVL